MAVPDRFSSAMTQIPWYVVVDDLIGGYAVSHINKPLSQQDPLGEGELANFLTEDLAQYIVKLHNERLQSLTNTVPMEVEDG